MNLGQEVPADLIEQIENVQTEIADLPASVRHSPAAGLSVSGATPPLVPLIATLIVAMIVIR